MLTYKTSLHDALYRHVEENVNPGLVITEPGESNLYFLSGTVVKLINYYNETSNVNKQYILKFHYTL